MFFHGFFPQSFIVISLNLLLTLAGTWACSIGLVLLCWWSCCMTIRGGSTFGVLSETKGWLLLKVHIALFWHQLYDQPRFDLASLHMVFKPSFQGLICPWMPAGPCISSNPWLNSPFTISKYFKHTGIICSVWFAPYSHTYCETVWKSWERVN